MRQGQNKQRSRGRGRKAHNPSNRSYDSNGPDVKIRGTAAHIAEKYATLARDAQVSGDRIASENYLQHAEHYNRIIAASQAHLQQQQAQQQAQQQQAQQQQASPPPQVTDGQETGAVAAVDSAGSQPKETPAEETASVRDEEDTPKVPSAPRPRRRRSPTGRNSNGARNKNVAADSAENPTPTPTPAEEAEKPVASVPELDQSAAAE